MKKPCLLLSLLARPSTALVLDNSIASALYKRQLPEALRLLKGFKLLNISLADLAAIITSKSMYAVRGYHI
jgi:hypothetical protein